ncbi:GroES-like protein [Wallemia mellicola]|nr:GroES-like protein [Wallemia mellicola]
MKGLIISDTRKAEVVEIDKPVLTGHNNVHSVAQNPPDSFSLHSLPGQPGNLLGSNFACVVVESKSDKIKAGDRVCGMVSGNHSAKQGAFADRTPNILIWGASTAVGMYAVQLSHQSGVNVVATTSLKNSDLVKSLGADLLFNYADVNVVDKIKQAINDNITFALDCVGNPDSLHKSIASVSDTNDAIVHTLLPPPRNFLIGKLNAHVKFALIHSVFAEDLSWANYLFDAPITQTEMDEEHKTAVKFFNYDYGTLYELISNNKIKTTPIFATSKGLENILPWLPRWREARSEVVR